MEENKGAREMIIWVTKIDRFSNGCLGKVGSLPFFSIDYNSLRSRSSDDTDKYVLTSRISQILPHEKIYNSSEDILKQYALNYLQVWLSKAGLAVEPRK